MIVHGKNFRLFEPSKPVEGKDLGTYKELTIVVYNEEKTLAEILGRKLSKLKSGNENYNR